MSEQLLNIDFSPKGLEELIKLEKQLNEIDKTVDKITKNLKNIGAAVSKSKGIDQVQKAGKEAANSTKELNSLQKEQLKISKQLETTKVRLQAAEKGYTEKLELEKAKLQDVNRLKKQQAKVDASVTGSINQMGSKLNRLISEYKNLTRAQLNNKNIGGQKLKQIQKLDREYKRLNSTLGRNQGNVGRYSSALKGLKTQLMGVASTFIGVYGLINVFKSTVKILKEFEDQMARVRAISGATDKQFKSLEKSAIRLGEATRYTALQVAQLQEQYAKLGFSTKEILDVTGATLNLAMATGEDLAQSALIAGSTLRAFQLDSENMMRVIDVMSRSFSSSALNLENFGESVKYVAPIAAAANINLEMTVALMAKLADVGLKGSIAGTSLRRLLSQLTDPTSDLARELGYTVRSADDLIMAFDELSTRNIDLSKATQLVDERSKAAFVTFVNGTEDIKKMNEILDNAMGSTEAMAAIMNKTLAGATDRLKSAWQGYVLEMREANNYMRIFVDYLAEVVRYRKFLITGGWAGAFPNINEMQDRVLAKGKKFRIEFLSMTEKQQAEMLYSLQKSARDIEKALPLSDDNKTLADKLLGKKTEREELETRLKEVRFLLGEIGRITSEQTKLEYQKLIEKLSRSDNDAAIKSKRAKDKVSPLSLMGLMDTKSSVEIEIDNINRYYDLLEEAERKRLKALGVDTTEIARLIFILRENRQKAIERAMGGKSLKQSDYAGKKDEKEGEEKSFMDNFLGISKIAEREIKRSIDSYISEMQRLRDFQLDMANEALSQSSDRINQLHHELDSQLKLNEEGKANNSQRILDEIQAEREKQKELQKEREKAIKNKQKIDRLNIIADSVVQSSNMIRASANIWESATDNLGIYGTPVAIALIAAMWGSFLGTKGKMLKESNKTPKFKEGVVDFRGDGTETSDDNTVRISDRESIIKASSTKKSKKALKAINEGMFSDDDFDFWNKYTPSTIPNSEVEKIMQLRLEANFDKTHNEIKSMRADMLEINGNISELNKLFKNKKEVIPATIAGKKGFYLIDVYGNSKAIIKEG